MLMLGVTEEARQEEEEEEEEEIEEQPMSVNDVSRPSLPGQSLYP
jgi:hypothetical protein